MLAVLVGVGCAAANAGGHVQWPEQRSLRANPNAESQAVSGGFFYSLVSQRPGGHGPFVLERTSMATGVVQKKRRVSFDDLSVASGRLWLSHSCARQQELVEVDPQQLARILMIALPRASTRCPSLAVASGRRGSVWIGTERTLLRVAVATGKTVLRVTMAPRLQISDIAVDPAGGRLYVSASHAVGGGGIEGDVIFEYDALSGRLLAHVDRGPITYSVAGAALTAVPGGVWVSFRTGMLGATLHLRERNLTLAPPGAAVFDEPATGVFHWAMWGETIYGGGALWLANQEQVVACIDPATGKVRARMRFPSPPGKLSGLLESTRREAAFTSSSGRESSS
ncbi:MAG TPA: hypothetical protein VHS03_10465 [Gaiellaceae bacterium]|nr:hypothetical protein [Gaiellaceae bacterium]